MQTIEMIRMHVNYLVTQARHDIYSLSTTSDATMKSLLLQRLWDTLSAIQFSTELLANEAKTSYPVFPSQSFTPFPSSNQQPQNTPVTSQQTPPQSQSNQRTFTVEELATFTGKNGRPAYIAVNGIVYDVTNNRAWAAATHFGLTAGKDYTQEFASCHTGQQSILATLPIVGRLA
ncbi:cytochrome b5 domain-containing protein [Sporosarcina sp. UB5]|uniref:cytochrome b5 domain-containing protein n=1 Tax=Sporosarcina sp. UB5 TaxID=3047463 RepID=UPI003D790E9F